jgi:hypothetical protein
MVQGSRPQSDARSVWPSEAACGRIEIAMRLNSDGMRQNEPNARQKVWLMLRPSRRTAVPSATNDRCFAMNGENQAKAAPLRFETLQQLPA